MAQARRSYTYLLGDSPTEAWRLRGQARLWDPTAHALFDRLKIRRGARVLEIGPGAGSLHRELRRRVRGPVDAVEPSDTFSRGVERLASRDGFGQRRAVVRQPLGREAATRALRRHLRALGVPVPA
jgi:16S rRNA A1518/A1519 N6-dimethyltransferase RsmA/KsgA/DIM1 with predicted DNA glycosylase/AP lyase activity